MTTALTIDTLKTSLANEHMKTLNNFFSNDEKKTLKFLSAVAYCAQSTPKLLECDKASIISAFMKCAEYNLFPSSVSGEAYILPYKNRKTGTTEAQFQLGYKGIITLLSRNGVKIFADIVRENDDIEVTSGFEQNIIHKYPTKNTRWNAIGVYAIAVTADGEKFLKYMHKDEVLRFKEFSQSATAKEEWQREKSPWNEKNDPELNMWRKTAIKQIAKNLPLTEKISEAIANDNASPENSIEEYHERKMIEYAKRESEGSVADLLAMPQSEVALQENATTTNEAKIDEAP